MTYVKLIGDWATPRESASQMSMGKQQQQIMVIIEIKTY